MSATRRTSTVRDDLRRVTWDGASFSLMVGLGETWIAAFALAAGLGEHLAGQVVVLPLVLGAVLGTVTPRAVRRLRSNRR